MASYGAIGEGPAGIARAVDPAPPREAPFSRTLGRRQSRTRRHKPVLHGGQLYATYHHQRRRLTLSVRRDLHRASLVGIGGPRRKILRHDRVDEELGAVLVRSVGELDLLVSEIMSNTRSWAVVGLTSCFGKDRPALSLSAVRGIVGPTVPIYLICWRVTIPLQKLLPNDLHVFGGAARIWWPIPQTSLSPASHPLVYDSTGQYGKTALADLESAYRASHPPSELAQVRS
jgi:hypothetical protein